MDLVMSLSDHVVVFDRGRPICRRAARRSCRTTPESWRPTLASEPRLLLELNDIEAGYGRAALVLRGLTVKVPPASVVCLVGPNGAGKSTVLKVASGMLTPRSGTDPGRRRRTSPATRRSRCSRAGLSHVLQGHSVFKEMTVAENVLLGAYTRQGQGRRSTSASTSSRRSSRSSPSGGTRWPAPCPAASRSRSSSPAR